MFYFKLVVFYMHAYYGTAVTRAVLIHKVKAIV